MTPNNEDRIFLSVYFEDEPLTWGEYVARLERFLRWLRGSSEEYRRGFFVAREREPWARIDDGFQNLEALLGEEDLGDAAYGNLDPVSGRLRADSTCVVGFRRFIFDADTAERCSRVVLLSAGMGAGRIAGASITCLSSEPTLEQVASTLKGCVRFWNAYAGCVMREPYLSVLGLEPNNIGLGPILFVSDERIMRAVRDVFECEPLGGGLLVRVGGLGNRVPESDDAAGMSAVRQLKALLESRGLLEAGVDVPGKRT